MNESIDVRFQSEGKLLPVVEFDPKIGVVFGDLADASPLNLAVGVQVVMPALLRPVQQRHDWRPDQFFLDARLDSGMLLLSGAANDPQGLPVGVYDLNIEVESRRFDNNQQRINVREGKSAKMVLDEIPDRRKIELRSNIDEETAAILDSPQSGIDGSPLRAWLKSSAPRVSRKACMLNVLAKLRAPAAPSKGIRKPLIAVFKYIYFADVDRIYAAAEAELVDRLETLVTKEMWVKEGTPTHAIHQRLKTSLTKLGIVEADANQFTLTSYRQGGRNCLQIVVAQPPAGFADPTVYADVDIDMGNPLWDLEGLIVHLGELLDSGRTDHLALYKKLKDTPAGDFLYYRPVMV